MAASVSGQLDNFAIESAIISDARQLKKIRELCVFLKKNASPTCDFCPLRLNDRKIGPAEPELPLTDPLAASDPVRGQPVARTAVGRSSTHRFESEGWR